MHFILSQILQMLSGLLILFMSLSECFLSYFGQIWRSIFDLSGLGDRDCDLFPNFQMRPSSQNETEGSRLIKILIAIAISVQWIQWLITVLHLPGSFESNHNLNSKFWRLNLELEMAWGWNDEKPSPKMVM